MVHSRITFSVFDGLGPRPDGKGRGPPFTHQGGLPALGSLRCWAVPLDAVGPTSSMQGAFRRLERRVPVVRLDSVARWSAEQRRRCGIGQTSNEGVEHVCCTIDYVSFAAMIDDALGEFGRIVCGVLLPRRDCGGAGATRTFLI